MFPNVSSASHRKLMTECCNPQRMFAVTKANSPLGKVLWYDGEFYHSHTVNNETHSLFAQVCGQCGVNYKKRRRILVF